MAIQPIDLQTLFTQVDKVGKTQSVEKEGLQIQQALQGAEMQRKTEEHIRSVNEAQNTGEGAEQIKDRRESSADTGHGKKRSPGKDEPGTPGTGQPVIVTDPRLGRNIDLSG